MEILKIYGLNNQAYAGNVIQLPLVSIEFSLKQVFRSEGLCEDLNLASQWQVNVWKGTKSWFLSIEFSSESNCKD